MSVRTDLTGNEAVAMAMKQINPDVVAAYPITPATEVVQIFSSYVADGQVDTEFVAVESEHSAMSAVVASAAAGARSMTATAANGLALMWEMLYIAASNRLPVVMPIVNRALSGPINIHCDHSDSMGARDSGWIQLYSENSQEVYDNLMQAVRIAEHPEVRLPVMVCMDGFIISHAMEDLEILEDAQVKSYVGQYFPERTLLDPDHPITVGPLALFDYYFEVKRAQALAMEKALGPILEAGQEFAALSGRHYGLLDSYCLEDAETAIVCLGSTAGTARVVVDRLRQEGQKVGLLKPRVFRPLPVEELKQSLQGLRAVAIMDRSDSFNGFSGPLFSEIRSLLYDSPSRPPMVGYIYGLGGRDMGIEDIESVYAHLAQVAESGRAEPLVSYLGVRE